MERPTTLFVPPDWIGETVTDGLRFRRFRDGATLEAKGAIASLLVSGARADHPLLRTIASADPVAADLVTSVARHGRPVPLTRDVLLRSTGYDTLFLELTARCNERCIHCYADSSPERTETLDPEAIDAIVEDAARLGFQRIQLTGGDPLTSPHVIHAARAVRRTRVPTLEVYTNGLALRGPLLDELAALEASFAFSFYSHDASLHDAITGTPGSQERTLRAIREVASRGLAHRVAIVVTELGERGLDETVALLRRTGVPEDGISIGHEHAVGRGRHVAAPSESSAGSSPLLLREVHAPSVEPFVGKIAVAPDGSVMPCIFARDAVLGNVLESRLATILGDSTELEVSADRLLESRETLAGSLSCLDCRLVRGALGTSPTRLRVVR